LGCRFCVMGEAGCCSPHSGRQTVRAAERLCSDFGVGQRRRLATSEPRNGDLLRLAFARRPFGVGRNPLATSNEAGGRQLTVGMDTIRTRTKPTYLQAERFRISIGIWLRRSARWHRRPTPLCRRTLVEYRRDIHYPAAGVVAAILAPPGTASQGPLYCLWLRPPRLPGPLPRVWRGSVGRERYSIALTPRRISSAYGRRMESAAGGVRFS